MCGNLLCNAVVWRWITVKIQAASMEDHCRGRSAHSWLDRRNTTLTFYWFVATPICRSCHQIKGIIEKVDTFNNICNNKEREKRKSSFMYNDWKLKLQKNHRGSKSFARLKTEENWKRAQSKNEGLSVLNQSF